MFYNIVIPHNIVLNRSSQLPTVISAPHGHLSLPWSFQPPMVISAPHGHFSPPRSCQPPMVISAQLNSMPKSVCSLHVFARLSPGLVMYSACINRLQ